MPQVDETHREIQLDEEQQDVVMIVSRNGMLAMIEPAYSGPKPTHVRLVEGLCRALGDPVLCEQLQEISDRAIASNAAPLEFIKAPTLN